MRPTSTSGDIWLTIPILALLIFGEMPPVHAEDDASSREVTITKTAERLHFTVPPDWPIEKRGGVMAPIPIEEYLAMKFSSIESTLQVLEQRLNGLDVRMRILEEDRKQRQQGLRSEAGRRSE